MSEKLGEANFHARLKSAMKAGAAGRAEIMTRLAVLPVERLAAVPPSIIAMIGPTGLAELATKRLDLAPLTAREKIACSTGAVSAQARASRTSPLFLTGLLILGIMTAAFGADFARPHLMRSADSGNRSVDTATWPTCPRLDTIVDGCRYRTGSAGLTLGRAAKTLGIDPQGFARTNAHLRAFADGPLPRGTTLVVWRGVLNLTGAR